MLAVEVVELVLAVAAQVGLVLAVEAVELVLAVAAQLGLVSQLQRKWGLS